MDAVVAYDLTKEYEGQAALSGLNLQVPQGEAFACVGERGCGKTTLVRLLSGLCRPTSGECTVLGLSPSHEPQRLHSVAGTVLDSAHLYTGMTLYENLHFFAGLHGLDDNDALERSSFLLHKLDIWEGRDLPVEKLSTGVVRRASLARALMHSPKVLLVDDSAGGLDQETAQATMWPRRRASPCSCAARICTLPSCCAGTSPSSDKACCWPGGIWKACAPARE